MERFVFITDVHWGYERKNGHKIALHDTKALHVALSFIKDFKPDHVILGGDILDCGCISHHNHGKPGAVEGFRLMSDAKELQKALIQPLDTLKAKSYTYIVGNHEDWLTDLTTQIPALEGIVDVRSVLELDKRWKVVPQGGSHELGKLVFIHGDQMKGGEWVAKAAVIAYEKSVRFGHYHTYSAYSKTSALDYKMGKTGIAVPCLCSKRPQYGEGAPNRWMQGFLYGYVSEHGFNDYVAIITNGTATINGKTYTS